MFLFYRLAVVCCNELIDIVSIRGSLFFFFKQKTAYEMRISEWSSDVCSSDLNPGDERAAKVMAIINRSYNVLCDPIKRREHDAWIVQAERQVAQGMAAGVEKAQVDPRQSAQVRTNNPILASLGLLFATVKTLVIWIVSYVVRVGTVLGVFALIIFALDRASEKQQPPPGPKPYTATPAQEARTAYARPANATNGTPWPAKAGYVQGLPVLASNGLSEIGRAHV